MSRTVRQVVRQLRWRITVWWRVRCLIYLMRAEARLGYGPWAYGSSDRPPEERQSYWDEEPWF